MTEEEQKITELIEVKEENKTIIDNLITIIETAIIKLNDIDIERQWFLDFKNKK